MFAFVMRTAGIYLVFGLILLGVTCARHGDRGPYPELEYAPYLPFAAALVARAMESKTADTTEKSRRVYYQAIVYEVCDTLDSILSRKPGAGVVAGTADKPSTEVQQCLAAVKARCQEWAHLKARTALPAMPADEKGACGQ